MKKEVKEKLYDLIPSQQTMYIMIKYSLHKQVIQIPTSFTIDRKLDFKVLEQALNIEIERNDSLRLRFIKLSGSVKQYFLPEYKVSNIPVKSFASEQEMSDFFDADAQTPVRFFKDETFRIYFYNAPDGGSGVYLNVCHLCMDAMAVSVFYLDLLGIYKSLVEKTELAAPLSSFEKYLQKEYDYLSNKEKYQRDEDFYKQYFTRDGEPFYAGIHGHDLLDKYRKKTKNPEARVPAAYDPIHDKADVVKKYLDPESSKKFFEFCLRTDTAPETLIQLGYRTHASSLNFRTPDVWMMVLCSRRAVPSTKRMGGCLTQPLQTRTIIHEDETFTEGLQKYASVRTELFRHMNFPYLTARGMSQKIYNYSMQQGPSCMMYTWLPIPYLKDIDYKIDFRGYNLGRYVMPLYVFSYPDAKTGGIIFHYMYKPRNISASQIEALHENCIKVMMQGIENPDITIGELLDSIS